MKKVLPAVLASATALLLVSCSHCGPDYTSTANLLRHPYFDGSTQPGFNPGFEFPHPRRGGIVRTTQVDGGVGGQGGASPAAPWTLQSQPHIITTGTLKPSTLPQGEHQMIEVSTTGAESGIALTFDDTRDPFPRRYRKVKASVFVKVLRGQVKLTISGRTADQGPNATHRSDTHVTGWQKLCASASDYPVQINIYSVGGPAVFQVDNVSLGLAVTDTARTVDVR